MQKLEESFTAMVTDLVKDLDAFGTFIAEEWADKNEVALESIIRTELAESFMSSLKQAFEEHYIDVPESKVDIVETLASRLEELEEENGQLLEKTMEKAKEVDDLNIEIAKREITEGLSEIQKEKLFPLLEAMTYSNSEEFKSKAEILKESVISKEKPTVKIKGEPSIITESVTEPKRTQVEDANLNPVMASYVSTLSRILKR